MSSRDQPFSDRASAFWGHHRLLVEQLAGVAGQSELGLECAMRLWAAASSSASTLGVYSMTPALDESLTFPAEQVAWQTPVSAATAAHRVHPTAAAQRFAGAPGPVHGARSRKPATLNHDVLLDALGRTRQRHQDDVLIAFIDTRHNSLTTQRMK